MHRPLLYNQSVERKRKRKQVKSICLIAILLTVEAISLYFIASFNLINLQTTATLLIFNTLFIPLIFLLDGKILTKICILTAGNIVGLLANLIFNGSYLAGFNYFGASFNAFYILIYPILNLTWIVPFWSLSLSFLPKQQPLRQTKD